MAIWNEKRNFADRNKRLLFSLEQELDKHEVARSASILWNPLTDEERELLTEKMTVRKIERNAKLYSEGSEPDNLYYLHRGKVTISCTGLGGQQQIVRMVEPGAIFGYPASFTDNVRKSSATAGADTVVAVIPMTLIFHLIWENGDFALLFLKELSMLLGSNVERTLSLTQKHIRGRLADALLQMRDKYGVDDDGQTLAAYLSRDDLANFSNMTTSNAIRTLSAFAQENLIAIDGRKIKFLNTNELKVISDRG